MYIVRIVRSGFIFAPLQQFHVCVYVCVCVRERERDTHTHETLSLSLSLLLTRARARALSMFWKQLEAGPNTCVWRHCLPLSSSTHDHQKASHRISEFFCQVRKTQTQSLELGPKESEIQKQKPAKQSTLAFKLGGVRRGCEVLTPSFLPSFLPFRWVPLYWCCIYFSCWNYSRTLCIKCWVSAFHTQI
jgi:hypothetical protein